MRFVELTAQNDISGELIISFEPMLAKYDDYVNHPAFWRLGMVAESGTAAFLYADWDGKTSRKCGCVWPVTAV